MEDGRLIDIPYSDSPPLLFTYRQTAAVAAGVYNFSASMVKTAFTPSRPLLGNTLYVTKALTFAMDIAQEDYHGAIVTLPEFSFYIQAEASAPTLREPLQLPLYLPGLPFTLAFLGKEGVQRAYPGATGTPTISQASPFNHLLGLVTGSLSQTPALLGKASITATVILSAQEIIDTAYISAFVKKSESARKLPTLTAGQDTMRQFSGRIFS